MTVKGSVSVTGSRQMGRFILPQKLLPTSDALLNIRSEFAGREGELASSRGGLPYLFSEKSPLLSLTTFPSKMDALIALLDEESQLFMFHAVNWGEAKSRIPGRIWKMYRF